MTDRPKVLIQSGEIHIEDLQLVTSLATDSWGRPGKDEPVRLSVILTRHDKLHPAAVADDFTQTLSYSDVAKAARLAHDRQAVDVHGDSWSVLHAHWKLGTLLREWQAERLVIKTEFPKGLNRSDDGWSIQSTFVGAQGTDAEHNMEFTCSEIRFTARNLRSACIIGINKHERESEQDVLVNIDAVVSKTKYRDELGNIMVMNFRRALSEAIEFLDGSSFGTVEALAFHTGSVFNTGLWSSVKISIDKPHAIAIVGRCGVTTTLIFDTNETSK